MVSENTKALVRETRKAFKRETSEPSLDTRTDPETYKKTSQLLLSSYAGLTHPKNRLEIGTYLKNLHRGTTSPRNACKKMDLKGEVTTTDIIDAAVILAAESGNNEAMIALFDKENHTIFGKENQTIFDKLRYEPSKEVLEKAAQSISSQHRISTPSHTEEYHNCLEQVKTELKTARTAAEIAKERETAKEAQNPAKAQAAAMKNTLQKSSTVSPASGPSSTPTQMDKIADTTKKPIDRSFSC